MGRLARNGLIFKQTNHILLVSTFLTINKFFSADQVIKTSSYHPNRKHVHSSVSDAIMVSLLLSLKKFHVSWLRL